MPQTIGKRIIDLKIDHDKRLVMAEGRLASDKAFNQAYLDISLKTQKDRLAVLTQRIENKEPLSVEEKREFSGLKTFLNKDSVSSIYGVIMHLFDVSFSSIGLDILDTTPEKLTLTQKEWLRERLQDLQFDLLNLHRRIALLTLRHQKFALPEIEANAPSQTIADAYQAALIELKKIPAVSQILDELMEVWQQTAIKIDGYILELFPAPQHIALQQEEEQKQSVATSSSWSSGFYFPSSSSHYHSHHHTNYFLYYAGWDDAAHNHVNPWLYFGSEDYRQAVVTRDLIECCNHILCDDSQRHSANHRCNGCGSSVCYCPDIASVNCPSCHSDQCVCLQPCGICRSASCECLTNAVSSGYNSCSHCGLSNCECLAHALQNLNCPRCLLSECCCVRLCDTCGDVNCNCLESIADCLKCFGNCNCNDCGDSDCMQGVVGGCGTLIGSIIGIVKKLTGTASHSDDAGSNTTPNNSTQPNPLQHTYHYITQELSTQTSSGHNDYLTNTPSEIAAAMAYLSLLLPLIARSTVLPSSHIYHDYKVTRSKIKLAASASVATGLFLLLYFPTFAGPFSAVAGLGGGLIVGNKIAKQYIRTHARKHYNGISNPEKWILKSDVLKAYKDLGFKPQMIAELLFALKDVKKLGAIKTNNKFEGAGRVLRALGYLLDNLKDDLELEPDRVLALLKSKDPVAITRVNAELPQIGLFRVAPPGGVIAREPGFVGGPAPIDQRMV